LAGSLEVDASAPRTARAGFRSDGDQQGRGIRAAVFLEIPDRQCCNKGQTALLRPLVFSVLLATLVQGVTSFSLTQLLSKAAQRLIADLREQVQAHISRLPVAFYDANKRAHWCRAS
jgi:ABC-type transport system involved in cytochrome bd biosynthesis fused ATPase/permease subunit